MGYPVCEKTILGNPNVADAWPDVEMVRNSKTEIQGGLAEAGRKIDEG
jgi:hypothetical protein